MNAGMEKFQNYLVQRVQYLKAIPQYRLRRTTGNCHTIPYKKGRTCISGTQKGRADNEIQVHVYAE